MGNEKLRERLFQLGIPKAEAQLGRLDGKRALSVKQKRRHLAEPDSHQSCRKRKPMRPSDRFSDCPAEFVVADGFGSRGIDRTFYVVIIQAEQDEPDHIVDMNPGEALFAGTDAASNEQSVRKKHQREGASLAGENQPYSQLYETFRGNGVCRLFPTAHDLR